VVKDFRRKCIIVNDGVGIVGKHPDVVKDFRRKCIIVNDGVGITSFGMLACLPPFLHNCSRPSMQECGCGCVCIYGHVLS
jgi:hypothetical protein